MVKRSSDPPLTAAVLHILLALARHDLHGYGIMKQVEVDSDRSLSMGPGTLYGAIGRMMDAGLVRESDQRVDAHLDDERRIYYGITPTGRQALATEMTRYRSVVAAATQLGLLRWSLPHGQ